MSVCPGRTKAQGHLTSFRPKRNATDQRFLSVAGCATGSTRSSSAHAWSGLLSLYFGLLCSQHSKHQVLGATPEWIVLGLFGRGLQAANFLERRLAVVQLRGAFLPRTPVEKERLGSLVQNTMTSEVLRFRAELTKDGAERLELARA
jgi:hypothetical protein